MSALSDLYKSAQTPPAEQATEKDILLVTPGEKFDAEPYLTALGLSRYEVARTWPGKVGADWQAEVAAIRPRLTVQLGCQLSRKFPAATTPEAVTPELRARALDPLKLADAFVSLHHHDEYSARDGLGTVEQLVELLQRQRRSFCCVTNHGSLGGWIRQYVACKKAGVKCLFGQEGYVREYRGDDPELKKKYKKASHLILLAKTEEGFYNLIRLHNDAHLDGFYYYPANDRHALKRWGKGLVGTTACIGGLVPRMLLAGMESEACKWAEYYRLCFDEFYVELSMIEYPEQVKANRQLIGLAQKLGLPMCLAEDSHYLKPEYGETHDLIMLINQHKTVLDKERNPDEVWQFDVHNLYYRTAADLRRLWKEGFPHNGGMMAYEDETFTEAVFEEALANTRRIALAADDIKLDSTVHLPKLHPDGQGELRSRAVAGMKLRNLSGAEYEQRLEHELGIIGGKGFSDYFLIVERLVADAKTKFGEWACGYGRGSGGGSLVGYCLGITDIDPIRWGLLFERFLDESRRDLPDFDLDFLPSIRAWLKDHVVELFGEEHVCSIGTYSAFKTRAVIVDVARALGYDQHEAHEVTKALAGRVTTENEEGEDETQSIDQMEWEDLQNYFPELQAYFELHPDILAHAQVLRNQNRNLSTHAGGVIISEMDLRDRVPVFRDKSGRVVSTWSEGQDTQELSSVGLVKFDLLGLRNLQVVADCVRHIETTTGRKLPRADIPIDDHEAISLCTKSDLLGIFQLENPGTKPCADAIQLESLNDVSALTSLIRPGPKNMKMDEMYARRKHGEKYEMPDFMRKLLDETYGIIVYQENAMFMARSVAGFTSAEANRLRKAIGKKQQSIMDEVKTKFIEGAKKTRVATGDLTMEEVEDIWGLIEKFAGYGFCKAHAMAYSALSCAELWLKYHYPVQFLTALINNTSTVGRKFGEQPLFVEYCNYARRRGIGVLPPCVNASAAEFTTDGKSIRYGLGHIKQVGNSAALIEAARPFASVADFYDRTDHRRVNIRVVGALVAAGAFSSFGERNVVLTEFDRLRSAKEPSEQRPEAAWDDAEREAIGMCLSKPPLLKQHAELVKERKWCPIGEAKDRQGTTVFGRIVGIVSKVSKSGNPMLVVSISDDIDDLRFYVFKKAIPLFQTRFREGMLVALPLKKFEDGNARFFDADKEATIINP